MPVAEVRPSCIDAVAAVRSLIPEQPCVVTDETHRRNSDLYRCDVGTAVKMVKFERGLTPQEARATADWSRQLRHVLEGSGTGVRAVEVHAALAPYPALVMNYVDGIDLSTLVASAVARARSDADHRQASTCVAMAGRALGVLHANLDPTAGDVRVLDRVQRRFHLSSDWRSKAEQAVTRTSAVGDFAPYNLRIGADGTLWMLDISGSRHAATGHEDVAHFLTGLTRSIRETPGRRVGPFSDHMSPLEVAFLRGYTEGGPLDPFESPHADVVNWLMRYYLSNVVIKSLQRGGRTNISIALSLAMLLTRPTSLNPQTVHSVQRNRFLRG